MVLLTINITISRLQIILRLVTFSFFLNLNQQQQKKECGMWNLCSAAPPPSVKNVPMGTRTRDKTAQN
jgi:hypothetical protein